jgi:hypothetical protein
MGLLTAARGRAQDPSEAATPVSVTGCLAQGDQANEYQIRDAQGKVYALMGRKVNLKPHVGHQVTITGTPGKPMSDKEGKAATEGTEHLMVTDLKMISTTCQ